MRIAFDIGGTKTRIAVSHDGASFDSPLKIDTPKDFDPGIALLLSHARELLGGAAPESIVAGVAGPLTRSKAGLANSPNLPGWVGKPLRETLERELGAAAYLENDSALVALGEAREGAGKGYPVVAYLTVSTGVGGARIVDGSIDRSVYGFEPGHQVIDMDGTVAPFLGVEAEELVSGNATEIRFGKKAYQVSDPLVWEELSRWVAYLLNNTIVHWSPDAVVLGGSMIVGDPAIPVDRVAHHLAQILTIYPELPPILPAALADMGGIHGGFAYLRDRH